MKVRVEPKARAIAEDILEATRACLMAGDPRAMAGHFRFPHVIDTFSARCRIETVDDFVEMIRSVIDYMRSMDVTDLVRRVITAGFASDDTIHFSHESRMMSGHHLVQPPYPNFSILRRRGSVWQVASSQYAIVDSTRHIRALCGKGAA